MSENAFSDLPEPNVRQQRKRYRPHCVATGCRKPRLPGHTRCREHYDLRRLAKLRKRGALDDDVLPFDPIEEV